MKESNYWQQFLNTGRVEDYLKFRNSPVEDSTAGGYAGMGDDPYAGIHKSNRDDFTDGAYRGIR